MRRPIVSRRGHKILHLAITFVILCSSLCLLVVLSSFSHNSSSLTNANNLIPKTLGTTSHIYSSSDDAFKQIYNNPSTINLKYDKYSNDLLRKNNDQLISRSLIANTTKKIETNKNSLLQNGCIYRIRSNYVYQDNQTRKMRTEADDWVQTGNYLGIPATYMESSSSNAIYSKKYKEWDAISDPKTAAFVDTASLKISLPNAKYNDVFANDPNLTTILNTRDKQLSLQFDKLKLYKLNTFIQHPRFVKSKLPVQTPNDFINDFFSNPTKYNHSMLRISPPFDFEEGRPSLGYSYVVCLKNHYYIYEYATDNRITRKSTFFQAPIAIFADISSKLINKNVIHYLQGMLFDTFGPNYRLFHNDPSLIPFSPFIRHYALNILKWLKRPFFFQKYHQNGASAASSDIHKYKRNKIDMAFPSNNTIFKIFMCGDSAVNQKFGIKKQPWTYTIAGNPNVTDINKEKGYKNEHRVEFNFSSSSILHPVFTPCFYFFCYLLAAECGECIPPSDNQSSSATQYNTTNADDVEKSNSQSAPHWWDSDTLAHGNSSSLFLFIAITFGTAVYNYSHNTNLNLVTLASDNLVVHNNFSYPSFDPSENVPNIKPNNAIYTIVFFIIISCVCVIALLWLLIRIIRKRHNDKKSFAIDDLKKDSPKSITNQSSVGGANKR